MSQSNGFQDKPPRKNVTARAGYFRCPHCEFENEVGSLFCLECKEDLTHLDQWQGTIGSLTTEAVPHSQCPACQSDLFPGAIACLDCGFLLDADSPKDETANLCGNPACGVANLPEETVCARCGAPLPLRPGAMIDGQYQIEKLLGVGGFGATYLAIDTHNNHRHVAVREMPCTHREESEILAEFFYKEVEILRDLQSSPIVPRFYRTIEQASGMQIVIEWLPGKDLLRLIAENDDRPFPFEVVVQWGKDLCDLLTLMHEKSPPWILRRLSPESILLLEDGRTIKVVDLSGALRLDQIIKSKRKTRVYDEGYAPPELIVGRPEPRSDLFALACTLYCLSTGKAPDGFYTAREIEEQLSEGGTIAEDQRWFYELLRLNLNEDFRERYASARHIKYDLEQRRVR